MAIMTSALWDQTASELQKALDAETYETWFSPIRFKDSFDGEVTLTVPSDFFRNWLISNYQEQVEGIMSRLSGREIIVRYETEDPSAVPNEEAISLSSGVTPLPGSIKPHQQAIQPFSLRSNRLLEHHNFDSFVVGESNRFAFAAAQAVADPSSTSYNPLFLYGNSGLGKTHLLQAIGRKMMEYGDHLSVLYVSTEQFVNAFIEDVKTGNLAHFRNCFRTVDLLMIDDVQFLQGKERTQTEFFHTFNDLFAAGKKIVISSDHSPRELTDLEERLRSRFEAGLLVDIQPPDLETRVAILRRKATDLNLELPPEIEIFIAEQIKNNIRTLEGALTKIQARHAVTGEPLSIPLARSVLGPLLAGDEPLRISVEKIQVTVSKFFGIQVHEMTGSNRSSKFSAPRQIACYLAREMTSLSFPEIAKKFGGRHHTSVIHAHRKVSEDIQKDLSKQNLVKYLTKAVKEEPNQGS